MSISINMKKYFENNPEAIQKNKDTQKKYYEDNPEARQKVSERQTKYYQDNPEARQQMSKRKKQLYQEQPEIKKKLLDTIGKNKPFDVSKIDGTFIKTFTYQFEAQEYLQKEYNITTGIKISEVLNGKRRSSAGFVFKYK